MEEDGKTPPTVAGDIPDEASENERQVQFHANEAKRFMVLVKQATQKISESEQTVLKCAICAGTHLLAAKKLLPHGRWQNWVKAHFGASARTARSYMQIAKHYGSPDEAAADGVRSIQAALNAIARHNGDLGPREVIGLNESMQYAKRAKYQLGQSLKDAFIRNIDDEVAVFLCFGPDGDVWDQLLEEMSSFGKEIRGRIGTPYEDWHARLLEEHAVERVEHCHRKIKEYENHKAGLLEKNADSQQRVIDENEGPRQAGEDNHASCQERQLNQANHAIDSWRNMSVVAERDLQRQRDQACQAPEQPKEANDDASPSSQSQTHPHVSLDHGYSACPMPVTT